MRSYFDANPFPFHEFPTLPKRYAILIRTQEAIGWGHLVRGRLSSEWANLQQDYVYRVLPKTKFDAAKWHRKIVNPMLVDCHNLWILRNEERHGKEQTQKRTRRLAQLERELIELYKYHTEVLASDRDIFSTPISGFLTLPPAEITKWIKSRKPIILFSRREARRKSVSTVRLLPSYYHPLRRTPATVRRAKTGPQRKLKPSDLLSQRDYDDELDTLMTEHFSRLPAVRARKPKPRKQCKEEHSSKTGYSSKGSLMANFSFL
jgi:hypothetical protein